MAVESSNAQEISVKIGCLLNHELAAGGGKPQYSIAYANTDNYNTYAEFDGKGYVHDSCPEVQYNQAGKIGSGFYMNSDASTLSFYCVEETNNTAKGADTAGMDVVGGTVIIGDAYYHNYKRDDKYAPKDQHVVPWGYIAMDDATLVNGGTVDIYGDMTNPVFKNEVTVDIKDTSDHFYDHRRSENNTRYKVHYFENFQGGGLYQAVQYNEGETTINVQGALYSHPGYRILGWCTKPDKNAEGSHYYQVGTTIDLTAQHVPGLGESKAECGFCGDTNDGDLLVLYAIWEMNAYTVKFDPNVPDGETYTGNMDALSMRLAYSEEKELPANQYKYPGHIFKGWNMQADGSGETTYADQQKVSMLSGKNGATVVLYAQWEKCDHTVESRWSYDVIDEGKTLRRNCSCGGQTLTAALYAEDTVYDGYTHTAELTLDTEAEWGNDAPKIAYTADWLEDDGLPHASGTVPALEAGTNKPYHAGRYTATVTKKGVSAAVTYIIAKAEQPAPEKPKYDVDVENNHANVKKLAADPTTITDAAGKTHMANAEYCLTYVNEGTINWQKMPAGQDTLTLVPQVALTKYFAMARYEELEDYKASEPKKADTSFFFAGNVTVTIVCEDGINCEDVAASETNNVTDGVTLTLGTDSRYYLVGGEYKVTAKLEMKDGANPPSSPPSVTQAGADNIYSVSNIPANSNLTITIGSAKKRPVPTAQVMPRQKFSLFTGTDTTGISPDSAFTAAFQIGNFDPCYMDAASNEERGVYTGLNLNFDSSLPANATVILVDCGMNGVKTFWYYRTDAADNSVALTEFKKMGGSESELYGIPLPAAGSDYVDLSYQFIVDFSQSIGYSGSSLKMTLNATVKDNDPNVPAVDPAVTVSMAEPTFNLKKTAGTNGLTNSFTCSFSTAEAASKWENRASALVLTPQNALPPDAQMKAEVAGDGTTYLYKNGTSFIVPPCPCCKQRRRSILPCSPLFSRKRKRITPLPPSG